MRLYQKSVVPKCGTQKGFKGKGSAAALTVTKDASLGTSGAWIALMDDVYALSHETKAVQPRYFYIDVQIRRDTCYVSLRWRTTGRGGSTLTFADVRFQNVLQQLPMALQRSYTDWEVQRSALNQRAVLLRRASIRQHDKEALGQFLLQW